MYNLLTNASLKDENIKFNLSRCICQQSEKTKSQQILYNKDVLILAIRDDHVDNYFSDKFVPLCHVDYFINGDRRH